MNLAEWLQKMITTAQGHSRKSKFQISIKTTAHGMLTKPACHKLQTLLTDQIFLNKIHVSLLFNTEEKIAHENMLQI